MKFHAVGDESILPPPGRLVTVTVDWAEVVIANVDGEYHAIQGICEHAGGRATDGRRRILDIEPEGLHHRVPTFLGAPDLVEMAGRYLAED